MMEKLFGALVVIILAVLINPFWMPSAVLMTSLVCLALIFLAFAAFFWKEKSSDEREQLHNYIGAKFGFLAGSAVLTLGIIIQGINHQIDKWLIVALGAMILGKIIGRLYGQAKK